MATSVLQIRVDDELRKKAAAVYEQLGIDTSTAVRMFLSRSVLQNGIPFSMTLPDKPYNGERAVRALRQLSEEAKRNGTANMTLEEINAEIAAARREREEREREERAEREGTEL